MRAILHWVLKKYLDSRYCHALCKEGFFPPAGYETNSKMTKITCKCSEEENSCQWVPDKPFIGCVGPCKQPIRSFENIDLFFKASFRENIVLLPVGWFIGWWRYVASINLKPLDVKLLKGQNRLLRSIWSLYWAIRLSSYGFPCYQ